MQIISIKNIIINMYNCYGNTYDEYCNYHSSDLNLRKYL